MKTAFGALALAVLAVITSLLAGVYIDLIVHQVNSAKEIIDAFGVHLDFARSERWRGFFVDKERTGEWKVHNEAVDITSFMRSNRVIGSADDPDNQPGGWDLTGYTKSDSKFLSYTGPDIGAGFYLLKAASRSIRNKPAYSNTFFQGYIFGWNMDEKDVTRFMRCPLVLIREQDVKAFQISVDDVKDVLAPMRCENLTFPALEPEKS